MSERLRTRGKCVVLRLFRLKHLPPAYNATTVLHERGVPVLVVEFGNLKEVTRYIESPLPTLRMASRWTRYFSRLQPLLAFGETFFRLAVLFLRSGRPNVLIAHGMQEQCMAWLLSVTFRVPVVVHVHEIYALHELDRFNRMFFLWGLSTLRRAKLLIQPEKSRARLYQTMYRIRTPYELCYNTPRAHERIGGNLREGLKLPPEALLMAYMGGIGKMHAFEEAFLALVEVPNVYFLIWGWGDAEYLEQLKKMARTYRVQNRVLFLGKTDEKKWSDLESCDFAYCVYKPEVLRLKHAATASNKLMEAMAAGLPVITSDSPDFKDIVLRLDIGVCADPSSSSSLALAIKELAKSREIRQRKGRNARRAHREEYNFETQFERALLRIETFFESRPALIQSNRAQHASK